LQVSVLRALLAGVSMLSLAACDLLRVHSAEPDPAPRVVAEPRTASTPVSGGRAGPKNPHPAPLVSAQPFGKTATEFAEMLAAFGIDPRTAGSRYTGWNAPGFKDVVRGVQQCMKHKFPGEGDWGPAPSGKFSGVLTEPQFRVWQDHKSDCPARHDPANG
jgi:hypothetical protein